MDNFRSIDDIPPPYRNIFTEYPCFNAVQSQVLDDILYTDNSVVVSAPTGSGKTAVFELAVIRLLIQYENLDVSKIKIVYISPIKALCHERLVDWHKKFSPFGLNCVAVTGDSDNMDFQNLKNHNLIISTPEKWDSLTRRWRDHEKIVKVVKLFMIDEVQLLNEENRGSTLEVIVCRMKTVENSVSYCADEINDIFTQKVRFIALSATVPNVEDIAEWIGKTPHTKSYRFSEEMRPVKLKKIVYGYSYNPKSTSPFKFDISLNYKLPSLIMQYSAGKPTLIFCSTRKSVEMAANHIVHSLKIHLSEEQAQKLLDVANMITDAKSKATVKHGIGYHHAGMIPETRHAIENLFRNGDLPVLVTTSTLAMGVNLPAHLVIVKSTKCYDNCGFRDYTETAIHQMIGRAGRPQFDTSATALILTTNEDKLKFEKMVGCGEPIESNLHRHLIEHLNAEVVLRTITDLGVAMQWLSSTFLYVRARKNPHHYGIKVGFTEDQLDKKLLEMCQIDLNKLVKTGMIIIDENITITPTVTGKIMAKYYVAFETMKLFTQISGTEILIQILALISKCQEFAPMRLRVNDKKTLNLLNKNSRNDTIRFPLNGRIKTWDMKVNCIIQAVLGNLDIVDHSILSESLTIMRNGERIAKCLIEYLETRGTNCYNALLNTIILAKCFHAKLWEDSIYVSKQLSGIGSVMSNQLANSGKTTFRSIMDSNPRDLEIIIKRKPPMGNALIEQVQHIPCYKMSLEKLDYGKQLELCIELENADSIMEKSTINMHSVMILLVGNSSNEILVYEKYAHSYMIENTKVHKIIDINKEKVEDVSAHFISEDWVGIDCNSKVEFQTSDDQKSKKKAEKAKSSPDKNGPTYIQMFLDMYMKIKKKATDIPAATKEAPVKINPIKKNMKSSIVDTGKSTETVKKSKAQHCASVNEGEMKRELAKLKMKQHERHTDIVRPEKKDVKDCKNVQAPVIDLDTSDNKNVHFGSGNNPLILQKDEPMEDISDVSEASLFSDMVTNHLDQIENEMDIQMSKIMDNEVKKSKAQQCPSVNEGEMKRELVKLKMKQHERHTDIVRPGKKDVKDCKDVQAPVIDLDTSDNKNAHFGSGNNPLILQKDEEPMEDISDVSEASSLFSDTYLNEIKNEIDKQMSKIMDNEERNASKILSDDENGKAKDPRNNKVMDVEAEGDPEIEINSECAKQSCLTDIKERVMKAPSLFSISQKYATNGLDFGANESEPAKLYSTSNKNPLRGSSKGNKRKVDAIKDPMEFETSLYEETKKRQKLEDFKFPNKKKFSHKLEKQDRQEVENLPDSTADNQYYTITEILEPRKKQNDNSDQNDSESDIEISSKEKTKENPQKSITWGSPLVFSSPAVKYSPKISFQNISANKDDSVIYAQNGINNETFETSISSKSNTNLTLNVQGTQKQSQGNTNRYINKNRCTKFPLRDNDYKESLNNDETLDICSSSFLEKLGLPNNQCKSTPKSKTNHAFNYYSQLLSQPIQVLKHKLHEAPGTKAGSLNIKNTNDENKENHKNNNSTHFTENMPDEDCLQQHLTKDCTGQHLSQMTYASHQLYPKREHGENQFEDITSFNKPNPQGFIIAQNRPVSNSNIDYVPPGVLNRSCMLKENVFQRPMQYYTEKNPSTYVHQHYGNMYIPDYPAQVPQGRYPDCIPKCNRMDPKLVRGNYISMKPCYEKEFVPRTYIDDPRIPQRYQITQNVGRLPQNTEIVPQYSNRNFVRELPNSQFANVNQSRPFENDFSNEEFQPQGEYFQYFEKNPKGIDGSLYPPISNAGNGRQSFLNSKILSNSQCDNISQSSSQKYPAMMSLQDLNQKNMTHNRTNEIIPSQNRSLVQKKSFEELMNEENNLRNFSERSIQNPFNKPISKSEAYSNPAHNFTQTYGSRSDPHFRPYSGNQNLQRNSPWIYQEDYKYPRNGSHDIFPYDDNMDRKNKSESTRNNFDKRLNHSIAKILNRSLSLEEKPDFADENINFAQNPKPEQIYSAQRNDMNQSFCARNSIHPQEWNIQDQSFRYQNNFEQNQAANFHRSFRAPTGECYPDQTYFPSVNEGMEPFPPRNDKEYVMNKFLYSLNHQ